MAHAVALSPDYDVARFQLGFLQLTSGKADAARATWAPLHALDDDHFMKLFVIGLEHMIGDRFEAATACLSHGIASNDLLPPMNADMQKLIDEMAGKQATIVHDEEPISAAQWLLRQYQTNPTRH